MQMVRYDRVTNILKIPYSLIYAPLPIGCLTMAVAGMSEYIQGFNRKRGGNVNNGDKYYFNIDCSAAGAAVLKVPVFISILSGSMAYFFLTGGPFNKDMGQRVLAGVESIPLLAIPFFICAGVFMNYSGVTKRVMGFCNVMTGRMTGGLAQVNVLLSTLMGGLSGSNLADAAMEAKMLVRRWSARLFQAVLYCGDSYVIHDYTLDTSGDCMILYGSIANISIGKLFIAGIGPGLLLCVAMMILVHLSPKKEDICPWRTDRLTMKQAAPEIASAYPSSVPSRHHHRRYRLGIFTPTEAGAVAIVYSLVLGVVYKELKLKDIGTGLKETVATTASIMLIVGGASAFAWILDQGADSPAVYGRWCWEPSTINTVPLCHHPCSSCGWACLLREMRPYRAGSPFGPGGRGIRHRPPSILYGLYIHNGLRRRDASHGSADICHLRITKCKIKEFIKESIPFYVMLFICMMLMAYVPVFSTGLVNLFY